MPDELITAALNRVASGEDLSAEDARAVLAQIMTGEVEEVQIAGFLIALRTKGETVEELVGLATAMRALATQVHPERSDLLDTSGTGGGRPSFNVSTTAALIAAAAGCAVAKHGNRSATSLSGSADLLEALGARIDLTPDGVARCIDQTGFGFMFAPAHHQATRYVVPVRKALAVRTIFNFLGPLTNPASASFQLIGVSDPAFTAVVAGAAAGLGSRRALIVRSQDGLDELSGAAPTDVIEVNDGSLRSYTVTPQELGVEPAESPAGGTPQQNAQTTRRIFAGEGGPERQLALLNAGAAIYAADRAGSIRAGVELATRAVDTGAAKATLEAYIECSLAT
ncbi:MAG: anthranilate phosphoribosyltransferase [Solirubrobacteraceae bacterium]